MKVNIIAMLTNNDKTVPNAKQVFDDLKDIDIDCWGFKDIGIDEEKGGLLVQSMKSAGKVTFMEPLIEEEIDCLKAARFAVTCNFDYVIGMNFYSSVHNILKKNGVKYFPTCGKRAGLPRMLYGSRKDIIDDAKRIQNYGVDGICLSVFRYVDGVPEELAMDFVNSLKTPFIVSGGINDEKRLDFIKSLNPWGFTIGSALFNKSFGNKSIDEKLINIKKYLSDTN
jgi:hypothetical protein